MIELKTYATKEICEALNIKQTSFKSHKEKFLKDYYYIETKVGRSKAYTVTGYKEQEKSEFIRLCEKLAGTEVSFPKERTAEKILKVLFQKDYTILDYEDLGYEIPDTLKRHTIGRYIDLFRKYQILPPKLPKEIRYSFDKDTGELFSKLHDPNKYVYYSVSRGDEFREELSEREYLEMRKFVEEKYSEYLSYFMTALDGQEHSNEERVQTIKDYKEEAKKSAYKDCKRNYTGVPMKTLSKVPTIEALEIFSSYFSFSEAA
ncbi:hypothetical protein [Peribacillus sp. FSL M8-0224]|uniref:hypothetical protein n=1 Tax=Peribacillus sp. FSL M8-0224 TaxID=2921568 RepID=UPI0030F75DD5|nr:hypothetical protein KY492_17620 [Brevibacterium sp. PAMC21349]